MFQLVHCRWSTPAAIDRVGRRDGDARSAPLSTSLTLSTRRGKAKSTRAEISVPAAPEGYAGISFIGDRVGLLVLSSTGASLTAVTVRLAVSVAVENAVMPPLLVVSASVPLPPLVWSQARNVMPVASVPW